MIKTSDKNIDIIFQQGVDFISLLKLSNEKSDYTEQDIVERKESIIDGFLQYLKNNELIG